MHTSIDSNLSVERINTLKNAMSSERDIPTIDRKINENKYSGRKSKKSLIEKINFAYDFKDDTK